MAPCMPLVFFLHILFFLFALFFQILAKAFILLKLNAISSCGWLLKMQLFAWFLEHSEFSLFSSHTIEA